MYDVIGDIHGHYAELCALLRKMGYVYDEGRECFMVPPGRKAVFIGDFIDRGSHSIEVVQLVRRMVENGQAHAIMGNHELSAVQWATPRPWGRPGGFLRRHSENNHKHHRAFLEEVAGRDAVYAEMIDFFKTLPLYLKLGRFCFVHACWQPSVIARLHNMRVLNIGARLTEEGWHRSAMEDSEAYTDVELLLKGPEERLAGGLSYSDSEGVVRKKARLAWWKDEARTFGEAYVTLPEKFELADRVYVPGSAEGILSGIRNELSRMPSQERIFIGHIWERGEPRALSRQVCCVDYSVAQGHKLAAYRIDSNETEFDASHFVTVDSVDARRPGPRAISVDVAPQRG